MKTESWYDDRGNLYEFLDWLESELCFDAPQIVRVVEKPWKWNREYTLFREWATEPNTELRERLVEAVDGEESAEQVVEKFISEEKYSE